MPRLQKVPCYCRHKARNLAYVTIDGRVVYLGRYGSEESKEQYARIIAERFATGKSNGAPRPAPPAGRMTINELIFQYWKRFVEVTYVKDGKPTERQYHIRQAVRPLKELFGSTLASEFGPRALKMVRDKMIDDGVESRGGLNRKYINDHVSIIKRMFRGAVSDELVDVAVYQALNTVENIRKRRDMRVKESRKVRPVPETHVNAVLPYVVPQVAAMIQIQSLTGMRLVQFVPPTLVVSSLTVFPLADLRPRLAQRQSMLGCSGFSLRLGGKRRTVCPNVISSSSRIDIMDSISVLGGTNEGTANTGERGVQK